MEFTNKFLLKDISVMFGRPMRHILRNMDTIITVSITPIAIMLLSFMYLAVLSKQELRNILIIYYLGLC